MYEIEMRWAGYIVDQYTATSKKELNDKLLEIKEEFEAGMTLYVQGIKMPITVLCVDVFKPVTHPDNKDEVIYELMSPVDFEL